jgi:hypothetical protein
MALQLPCGCRTCGCLCAEHAPERIERLCPPHADQAITKFIAHEAATLVALALFIASIAVVAGLWAFPSP